MRNIVTKLRALGDIRTSQLYSQRKTLNEAADEIEKLQEVIRYGIGSAINELTARGLPKEWSRGSGIGRMLLALGCNSTTLDDVAMTTLELK